MILNDVLCVIPARGGSKGILNKNLRLLGKLPLVAHSILQARLAGIPDDNIIVSSDSEEIIRTAAFYGAMPVIRPKELSGDTASTEMAMLHTLDFAPDHIEHILLLQATSPIRLQSTVKGFLQFYLENGFDSALTVTEFHDFFWHVDGSKKGKQWKSTYDPQKRPMRQTLSFSDDRFFDNGNMYLTNICVLQDMGCRLGKNVGVYPISELEGMQIDTPQDLLLFEAVFDGNITELTGV